ncbi:threonine aldolase family protein [Calycomorphotria hydatis]|uniref:L-allo-threonine aldolase n=1 Tax=Calycomorphotria hydatis TaxID=2528027 RepID=A0A517TC32_9PLAN|nr:GntG family PLP-dependent aldolase [Calycomorphotria hydatis]QDT65932.1 L-allo-threonine aldolase [Calycomorphotria hydatis]
MSNTNTPRTIDLRSDTKTLPTPGMYQAMLDSELGDDMEGEDPTVNRLQEEVANLLGKEAALFCVSGTMSNQLGIRVHCQPGDELLIHKTGHIANYEGGAPAAVSGITCRLVEGERGMPSVADFEAATHTDSQLYPRMRLVCLENTTNIGGGAAWRLDDIAEISTWARDRGLKMHLDGARLFNACVARGYSPGELAQHFDTISICFSKGLGCPLGSILVGSRGEIAQAFRARKIFGGALRQSGIIAATALYALEHHVDRLADDHANARWMAEQLATLEGVTIDTAAVETNLLFFELAPSLGTAREFVELLQLHGVAVMATGPQRIRICTHLNVVLEDIQTAFETIRTCLANIAEESGRSGNQSPSAESRAEQAQIRSVAGSACSGQTYS